MAEIWETITATAAGVKTCIRGRAWAVAGGILWAGTKLAALQVAQLFLRGVDRSWRFAQRFVNFRKASRP